MCGVAAGAPLDIVRIRQQQASQAAVSALRVFRDIVAREGKISLFKGLAYPLYTASFQVTIRGTRQYAMAWRDAKAMCLVQASSLEGASSSDRAGQSGDSLRH